MASSRPSQTRGRRSRTNTREIVPSGREKRHPDAASDSASDSDTSPNSEGTREGSSEPQEYQSLSERPRSNKRPRHHERPTSRSNEPRTQATQARDLSQLVREALAANVTSNGKRINHAAIWKAVGDNYQQPKTRCGPFLKPSAFQLTRIHRMDAAVVDMYHAARWIYRLVGPFLNIKTMFISGAYIEVSTGTINHSIFGY